MLPLLIVEPTKSHDDPTDDADCVPVATSDASDAVHNACNAGLRWTSIRTKPSPVSPISRTTLEGFGSTRGDFSRWAEVWDSRGRRPDDFGDTDDALGVACIGCTRAWGGMAFAGVTSPVTEFTVGGCSANHDSPDVVIVPRFRNREPVLGTSQKTAPNLK